MLLFALLGTAVTGTAATDAAAARPAIHWKKLLRHAWSPGQSVEVDGVLYFNTLNKDGKAWELWRSDASPLGARKLGEFKYASQLIGHRGQLFFVADDGVHGFELWRSDGSASGTVLIRDINPHGSASASGMKSTSLGLLFSADDGVHGHELWRSDGTAEGTRLIKDLVSHKGGARPEPLAEHPGGVLFKATQEPRNRRDKPSTEIWQTDGTAAGTQVRTRVGRDRTMHWSVARWLGITGRAGYFTTGSKWGHEGLWCLELEGGQGRTLSSLHAELAGPSGLEILGEIGGRRVLASRPSRKTGGVDLWLTDCTPAGTVRYQQLPHQGRLRVRRQVAVGELLYFRVVQQDTEIWRTDGTAQGTWKLLSQAGSHDWTVPKSLFALDGSLMFVQGGDALWRSNGKPEGARLVKDFHDGTPPLTLQHFTVRGTQVFFHASTGAKRRDELWRSDGTARGTRRVLGDGNPAWDVGDTSRQILARWVGETLFTEVHAGDTVQLLILGAKPRDTRVIWHRTR